MTRWAYRKGAHYERELLKKLQGKGFFVTRAAGSGVEGTSPDLIVLSTTKKFALECKAWEGDYVRIDKEKLGIMHDWERRTGMPVYIGWKRSREAWRFFPLIAMKETGKAFVLSETDLNSGMTFEELVI